MKLLTLTSLLLVIIASIGISVNAYEGPPKLRGAAYVEENLSFIESSSTASCLENGARIGYPDSSGRCNNRSQCCSNWAGYVGRGECFCMTNPFPDAGRRCRFPFPTCPAGLSCDGSDPRNKGHPTCEINHTVP